MPINIFSTYSTGENRVTASFLAVLQSLSLQRTERLLGALLEQADFEIVSFENQPSKGGTGVPDAVILSSIRLFIETKIARNMVDSKQLQRHLKRFEGAKEARQLLLVITPDDRVPQKIVDLGDKRVVWASFAALDQAINELLADALEVVSEREEFLLRELQAMLQNEGFVPNQGDVVVVAARSAWPEYENYHAYVCQPDRRFRPVERIAFYSDGQIHPMVPRILESHDHVEFIPENHKGKLRELIQTLMAETSRKDKGKAYKVMFLSPPDSRETVKLPAPVINDLRTETGRTTAYTQGQRYTTIGKLLQAKTTSDLESD
jgi:hypothetical protein